MTRIKIRDGSHPYSDNPHYKEHRAGTVLRNTRVFGDKDVAELEVQGIFCATLKFEHSEQGHSNVTLWFRADMVSFAEPDDHDRYNAPGVPAIEYVPMRFAAFENMMQRRTLISGGIIGTFRFNQKGPSVSVELVR